jgi:hypothetical protein
MRQQITTRKTKISKHKNKQISKHKNKQISNPQKQKQISKFTDALNSTETAS